jgi:sterol desaturase/sphingolipid hydroxylase (fatty acid hydroxylase superfamily)
MGFEAFDIVFMYAATQVYGFWVHTETVGKLPNWFEFIFVTPSHHRVHHASNVEYLDSNMGMVLIIWDRIFGTFRPELDNVKVRYGLTKNLDSFHPIKVVFHEWKAISSDIKKSDKLKDKLMYIFGPPGWSHDGSSSTSKQLRAKENI